MSNRWLFCVLLVCVLLSGCIKIQIREEIDASGISAVTMILEPINATQQEREEYDEDEDPCDQLNMSQTTLTNVRCRWNGKKAIITGKFDRRNSEGLQITGNKYRLDVMKAIEDFNEEEEEEDDKPKVKTPGDREELIKLKETGLVYDYYVKLPGKVTEQVGGEIQPDGSVKFDILELPEGAYVESKKSSILPTSKLPGPASWFWLAIGGTLVGLIAMGVAAVIALVVLFLLITFIRKKLKKRKTRAEEESTPEKE